MKDWGDIHSQMQTCNMASTWFGGCSRKCIIYAIAAVILIFLIILLNFAYLPGRRFTVGKNINTSSSLKVSATRAIPVTTKSTITSTPKTITPKVPVESLTLKKYQSSSTSCDRHEWKRINTHQEKNTSSICYTQRDPFICFSDPVHCEQSLPMAHKRGDRRWPKYGEYNYLPKEKWTLVALHGGVVFLYHPCANRTYVDGLRRLAKLCLRRYVLTPYERLDKPVAMVTWGCFFSSNHLNWTIAQNWIKKNAIQAPASHVYWNGDFREGLLDPASVVTDLKDTLLCPTENISVAPPPVNVNKKKPAHHSSEKVDSNDASWNNGHVVVIVASPDNTTQRERFDSVNAAWALGSVIFLCLILLVVMMYTKPWEQRQYWWRTDLYDSNTKFSLLKSKRYPVKVDWRGKSRNKGLSVAQARPLLGAIPEKMDSIDDDL